jgi:hypothetical protein
MQNPPNKMTSLFYTGFALVSLPLSIIGFLLFFATQFPNDSAKPIPPKKEEPIVERKIVYDTVRVEIPEIRPTRKKITVDTINRIKKDSVKPVVVTETLQNN